jgi:hypothetical protein
MPDKDTPKNASEVEMTWFQPISKHDYSSNVRLYKDSQTCMNMRF